MVLQSYPGSHGSLVQPLLGPWDHKRSWVQTQRCDWWNSCSLLSQWAWLEGANCLSGWVCCGASKGKKIKMGSLIFLTHGKRCSDPSNQRAIIQSILDLLGHFFQKLSESWNSFMEKQIFLIIFGKDQLLVNSFTLKGRVESSPSPQRVI